MGLFKNIKQKFCKHYFVFYNGATTHEYDDNLNQLYFRCAKCGMRIEFKTPILEQGINNTFVEYTKLKRDYLNLIAFFEPEIYTKEQKRLFDLK